MKSFKELLESMTSDEEKSYNDQTSVETKGNEEAKEQHRKLSPHYSSLNGINPFSAERKHMSEEHGAIHDYVDTSRGLNQHLWDIHHGGKGEGSTYNTQIKHLDDIMNSHKTPYAMHVWSGIKHDPRHSKNENDIVHHPGYLSTSIMEGVARRFSRYNADNKNFNVRHTLKIHVPQGSPGIYLGHQRGNARGYENGDIEKEFIIPRGHDLQYHHTTTDYKHSSPTNPMVKTTHITHHMSLLPKK